MVIRLVGKTVVKPFAASISSANVMSTTPRGACSSVASSR
jgi:hypothetical protein